MLPKSLSLKTKITLAVAALFIATNGLLIYLFLAYSTAEFDKMIYRQQSVIASALADSIDEKLRAIHSPLIAAARAIPAGAFSDAATAQQVLQSRSELPSIFDNGVFLLSKDGKLIAESPSKAAAVQGGADASLREFYLQAAATLKPAISKPHIATYNGGMPAVMLTAPVLGGDGKLEGVLLGSLLLQGENVLGSLPKIRIGNTGYVFVSDKNRTVVAHPDKARILKTGPAPGVNEMYDRAIDGYEGSGKTITTYGVKSLTSFKSLRATSWILGVIYPEDEAYAPLRTAQRYFLGITVSFALVLLAFVWYLINRFIAPLTALTAQVRNFSPNLGGAEPRRKFAASGNDEVGELASAFNRLLERLEEEHSTLQASEERSRGLLTVSSDGIWIHRAGEIQWVNDALVKMLGYDNPGELIGKQIFDQMHPDMREFLRQRVAAVRATGNAAPLAEAVMLRKDGSSVPVETSAAPFVQDGALWTISIIRDITERKRNEEAARLSERKYAAVFNTVSDAIAVTRRSDATHLELNAAWEKMTGYTRAQALGRSALELGVWANPAARDLLLSRLARDGAVANVPTQFVRADGSVIDVLASAVNYDIAGEACVVWSWSDISELREAERKAESSLRHFAAVFENSPDPIAISRRSDHALLEVNDAWVATSGVARERAIGRTAQELGLWTPGDRAAARMEFKAKGRLSNRLMSFIRADGAYRHVLLSTVPIERDGEPCHVTLARDVTELRAAEMERSRAEAHVHELNLSLERKVDERTAELEAAIRDLESFSYSVSHDLRAPLRSIAGFASVLRSDYGEALAGEPIKYFERIERAALRMGELIDDLLEFSRIGRAALDLAPTPMNPLVDAVVTELRDTWGARARIAVSELPAASCDERLVRLVWQNLVGNALKFSSKAAEPLIEIGGKRDGKLVEYWVRDNGAGFDMNYADKLFAVFQRLHGPSEFEGTGIGLATVQRIVLRHNGSVKAEGRPGAGATFSFTLPAA
jgi:PAS domain S-box-containing protein